jgi:hypothetical protein
MKKIVPWLVAIVVLLVIGGGLYGWWAVDLRWRPHTIKSHQAEIGKALEGAGWVSPKIGPGKLYMVSYRSCPDCIRFEDEMFPKLQAAGVDTRVIMVARADLNGQSRSTPPERATVAELWINRSWKLYQQWTAVKPATAWTAPGVAPADGDTARTAVVDAGHNLVEQLRPMLKDNGIKFAYPTLIWWDKKGVMRGCACEKAQTYRYVLKELGAS